MHKILHISTADSWRGGEQQLSYVVESLSQTNTLQVIFCPAKSPLERYCMENKIVHYTLHKPKGINLNWAKKIKLICEEESITIIHCHDSRSHTFSILSNDFYANKLPIVVHRRVIFKLKKSLLTKYKYNHPSVKKIVCISHAVEYVVNEVVKKNTTQVIYDAIKPTYKYSSNINFRQQFNIPKAHKLIVYIAALTYEKDHFTFINTAKELLKVDKELTFLLIGEGKLKHEIINKIEALNLNKSIILTGFIKDVKMSINQFDVLLFTSKFEGLGSTILDFFMAKIPVVCTENGGSEEIIKNNFTGILCKKEDVTCLSKSVLKIISDSNFKNQIVNNAYDYVIENHDIIKMGQEIATVYDDIKYSKNGLVRLSSELEKDEFLESQKRKLSGVIITFNEEKKIAKCLMSLEGIVDEIVVVDSFSEDGTEDICKKHGVRFIKNEFIGHIEQKNFAISQAKYNHILSLDADEVVSEALKKSILTVKENLSFEGYTMNRRNFYCGKKIKYSGWYPDIKIRLFDRRKAKWGGENPHDEVVMKNKQYTEHLEGDLLHYTFDTIQEHELQMKKFAKISANFKYENKNQREIVHLKTFISPIYRFLSLFFFKKGFLDGTEGFKICYEEAKYTFRKYNLLRKLYKNGK